MILMYTRTSSFLEDTALIQSLTEEVEEKAQIIVSRMRYSDTSDGKEREKASSSKKLIDISPAGVTVLNKKVLVQARI